MTSTWLHRNNLNRRLYSESRVPAADCTCKLKTVRMKKSRPENKCTETNFFAQSDCPKRTPSDPKAPLHEPQHTPKTWLPKKSSTLGTTQNNFCVFNFASQDEYKPKPNYSKPAEECTWEFKSKRIQKSGPGNQVRAKYFCAQSEGPENTPSDPKAL